LPLTLQLNWSAPLDAAWVNGGTLKCHSPGDVIALLKASLFASHDLAHAANTVHSSIAAVDSTAAASSHSAKCEAAAAGRFVQPDWSSHLASGNTDSINASGNNSSSATRAHSDTAAAATDSTTAGGNDAVTSATDSSSSSTTPSAVGSGINGVTATDTTTNGSIDNAATTDDTSTGSTSAAGAVPLCLVLRKWCNFIPSMLFRCFVTQDR
jgi:D123